VRVTGWLGKLLDDWPALPTDFACVLISLWAALALVPVGVWRGIGRKIVLVSVLSALVAVYLRDQRPGLQGPKWPLRAVVAVSAL
jgi:hypothetical protein